MTTQLDIDLLRNFAAIAEAGVMSRAADRVGRTQAALSQQVKRLELAVQQTLMIRTGRGITLTLQGERLLQHAQKILRTHDEAVAELMGVSLSGNVRFGCPDDYARVFFLPCYKAFPSSTRRSSSKSSAPRRRGCWNGSTTRCWISRSFPCPTAPSAISSYGASPSSGFAPKAAPRTRSTRYNWRCRMSIPSITRQRLRVSDKIGRILSSRLRERQHDRADRRGSLRPGDHGADSTAVPPDLQVIPLSTGLPKLPSVGITVKTGRSKSSRLLKSFETHIRSVLPTL